jgi:large subunit ribosomal protein L9
MKIILNKDIPTLGEEGDVKTVKDGYARNFLIPQKLAFPFNDHYKNMFEQKRAKIEARKKQKRELALSLKDRLNGKEFEFLLPAGENGKLFGALTTAMISAKLAAEGMEVEKRHIHIPGHTIKAVGNYEIKIHLLENQSANIKVIVKPQT